MKRGILHRYACTDSGEVIIDVAAGRIQDLYNDFDKTAPYVRKDLDQDFVDHLVDCAREIGKTPFVIRIVLNETPTKPVAARTRKSIRNFFLYLRELELRKMRRMMRISAILLGLGVGILAVTVWLNQAVDVSAALAARVLVEGLTVAAWVSLWEALATFLIQWAPHRQEVGLFKRLACAPVLLASSDDVSSGS